MLANNAKALPLRRMSLSKISIPLEKARYFSKLFLDYQAGRLKEFYLYEPNAEGIKAFTEKNPYENLDRALLVKELKLQNAGIKLSEAATKNIDKLADHKTYTITTGHQLCLATGPLYFIYKILSVINLAEALNEKYSDVDFVPVYWMATEDHDFEEVSEVNLFNKKFKWQTSQKGRVGEFALEGVSIVLDEVRAVLGENENAKHILSVLQQAYSQKNLADATRYLVNELFGQYGLIILDGNCKTLKHQFIPEIKKDLFDHFAFHSVNQTIDNLKKAGYEAQVSPREINCFYAAKGLRERIILEGVTYKVLNTEVSFSKSQIENLIENETEKFSPNVVMRPLYQQKILPNAAYVGGPGEIAYWLEYKRMFAEAGIPYPVIVPRNFVMYLEKGLHQRMEKLGLEAEDIFNEKQKLQKEYVLQQQPFDISAEKAGLENVLREAKAKIAAVDKTLEAATEAELQKALKGLEALEQKVIRSIKQRSEQSINQVDAIHSRFFPGNLPQERVENFLRFYITNPNFIRDLKETLPVLERGVSVLSEN